MAANLSVHGHLQLADYSSTGDVRLRGSKDRSFEKYVLKPGAGSGFGDSVPHRKRALLHAGVGGGDERGEKARGQVGQVGAAGVVARSRRHLFPAGPRLLEDSRSAAARPTRDSAAPAESGLPCIL
jgi:hypothetical protein